MPTFLGRIWRRFWWRRVFVSPKANAMHFYSQTALADLLGIPTHAIYDNRLYRALDKVFLQKEELEKHLKERLGELFQIKYELFLYDITSTYFAGAAEKNAQAQRGHSRDHHTDCKQVLIALVVTKEGIPLAMKCLPATSMIAKPSKPLSSKWKPAMVKPSAFGLWIGG